MQILVFLRGYRNTNRSLEERETVEETPFSPPEIQIIHCKPTSSFLAKTNGLLGE